MKQGIIVLASALWLAGWSVPLLQAEDPTSRLEKQFAKESNPKKRVKLAIELTKQHVKQLGSAYQDGEPALQAEASENYLAALDRLGKAVAEASNAGASKGAELQLSQQLRQLADLKMSISSLYRPALETVIERATSLREEILYSIMTPPPKESAKK